MSTINHLQSDEELISLISADNKEAFTILYHRYWEMLLAMAYARLRNMQGAEDVVHDVFSSIWLNRKSLQIINIKSYLAAATRYLIIAHYRKCEYANNYAAGILSPESSLDNSPETETHFRLILKLVNEEVNKLPEKCRLIFQYSKQQGMKTKEISQLLNISPKTVDNQLNKAIHHLRHKMKHILKYYMGIL
ncbi:MAG TPA: sigma-70 family RNA polymerase sigma factor [Chitinophaga sp.]|uniref:RNA polymerase sigma factor n=1 Tax=Chitinophaga sp. TaxID=1869181 RepID=UPI002CE81620|nr:sigma-70 family RNA polymerase sigma factor [Chitinophaga sp.]HVI48534.1 sigma-70 family RNA polymerase sigma factor [Chitinophaga sp.]